MTSLADTDSPRWDEALSMAGVKSLCPVDRGRRTEASLTRKIETIERWGREGTPPGIAIPKDRAKLRRWTDPAQRLWSWRDPQVDKPGGRNSALMSRFRDALQLISVRQKRSTPNLANEILARDRIIESLEHQNVELLDQVRRLQKAMRPSVERR